MFITGKHIPRRALLKGLGVSLALPLLDSMIPALQPLASAAALPKVPRFAGIFSPHGWAPEYWQLPKTGAITEYPFVLKPIEAWREHITVISGLDATSSMPPVGGMTTIALPSLTGRRRRRRSRHPSRSQGHQLGGQ